MPLYYLSSKRKIARSNDLAGGKARNLAALYLHGFPVPEFVVITTSAHRFAPPASELLAGVAKMCRDCRINLYQEAIVARSSAPFEDLTGFSLAGQLDSVLNIQTVEQLIKAIQRVWSSCESPHLNNYLKKSRKTNIKRHIAVILQKQIHAQICGVMFTSHPLSDKALLLIELKEGGCDPIVSGQVTPDQVIVDKRENKVIYQTTQSALTKHFVGEWTAQLVQLGKDIERLFKMPMDVEWAWQDDQFWIIQARPITISSFSGRLVSDQDHEQWTDYFFAERFDRAVSPLAWSFLGPIISKNALAQPLWFLGRGEVLKKKPLSRLFEGIPHTRLEVFQALYSVIPPRLISQDKKNALMLTELQRNWFVELLKALPFIMTRVFTDMQFLPPVNLRKWQKFVKNITIVLEELRQAPDVGNSRNSFQIFEQTRLLSDQFLSIHRWSITFADIFIGLLDGLIKRIGALFSAEELFAGMDENATVEADLALDACDPHDPTARQQFLRSYGHRGSTLDFSFPTWNDAPEMIFDRIHQTDETILARIHGNRLRRNELMQKLDCLVEKKSMFKRALLRIILSPLVEISAQFYLLRENQRDFWHKILYITRQAALSIGKNLQTAGYFKDQNDVFLLTRQELRSIVLGGTIDSRLLHKRKVQQSVNRNGVVDKNGSRSTVHVGIGVSKGTSVGRARVVHNYDDAMNAQKGEIVVAPSADPAWTTIFGRISGLILENGGVLSHASIVAREFRVPTVNIRNATMIFKNGDLIALDGEFGVATLVQSESNSIDADD